MRRDKLYGSFSGTQSTASFSRDFARAPCSWCVTTSTRCSRCDRDMLPCNPKECCKNAAREQIGEALVCRPAPRTQRSVRLRLMPQHGAAQKSKSSGGWRLCLCRILREAGNALGALLFYHSSAVRTLFSRLNASLCRCIGSAPRAMATPSFAARRRTVAFGRPIRSAI